MRYDKEYQGYLRGECEDYNQSLISALEAIKKGGINMATRRDDQCEECGAATGNKIEDVDELKVKNLKLTELCERLLDHITDSSVYAVELEQAIYSAWRIKWKEAEDEKSRLHNNKNGQDE